MEADEIDYAMQSSVLVRGHGFSEFDYTHVFSAPAAHKAPLTAIILAPATWIAKAFSWDQVAPQRLTMVAVGVLSVVLIYFLGRRIGGKRAALIAGSIAAIYPGLWQHDGLVMSESLAILITAGLLLACQCYLDRREIRDAASMGLLVGLAALTRPELVLFGPLLVVPIVLFGRSDAASATNMSKRLGHLALSAGIAISVVATWVGPNLVRFDEPVTFTTGEGMTVQGSNCDTTYYGPQTGSWDFACATKGYADVLGDDSVRQNAARSQGYRFLRSHLSRYPAVVAARIGRVWSLFHPFQDHALGIPPVVINLGHVAYFALTPIAFVGTVVLRRRRKEVAGRSGATLYVLLTPILVVTITAGFFAYGLLRFRAPAEVALVILAALAIDRWITARRSPQSSKSAASALC